MAAASTPWVNRNIKLELDRSNSSLRGEDNNETRQICQTLGIFGIMPPMLAAGEAAWPYFYGEHPKRSSSIVSWTSRDLEIRPGEV